MLEQINFAGRRRTPVIWQSEGSECGLACIAMVASYHGRNTDLIALRQRFQMSLKGATLKQLLNIAEELGFSGRPLRGEISALQHVALPVILHWNLNHYVVLTRISDTGLGRRYHIHDPASGARKLTEAEISKQFSGVLLELVKSENFQPQSDRTRLRINQLWTRLEGFWPAFRQMLALSFVLQIGALVAPFFMQVAIDNVLPSADTDLLLVLALGFGGVAAVTVLAAWARSLVLLRLSTSLSYQVNVNLFRHLLRLPLTWFERRHVGDVISRFGSTRPISDLLSQGLIASLLDGIMVFTTLVLMLLYSPVLTFLSMGSLLLILSLRLGFFSALKQANVDMISANARENSTFIETMRGVATIKAFGEEGNRQRLWQQKKAEAVNAEIKSARINANFSAGEGLVTALERILFVYIAIRFAVGGNLSLGMIFAMLSYRQQFLDATLRLIQQAISYRLLDMHLARIGDIALSPPESLLAPGALEREEDDRAPARIELRNVWFRYSPNEPDILKGVNLSIEAGEMIALVGASGGGKTTLIKVMMGLLAPSVGEVLINGQPLSRYGLGRWRREIGSVAQDDALFAGSLADNISMFDPQPDQQRVEAAAKAASIHAAIQKMPMGYHTSIGDMGSVLSGGQKQRVILARAIYRRPSTLLLDEATAHLDPQSEMLVGDAVRSLECTRIVIAHRPQTIERADRRFVMEGGRLVLHDPPPPAAGLAEWLTGPDVLPKTPLL